jgi:hypothetical protein
MTKFVLIAILHLNSGIDQTDVVDYDLTGDDCIESLMDATLDPAPNTEYACMVQEDLPIDAE